MPDPLPAGVDTGLVPAFADADRPLIGRTRELSELVERASGGEPSVVLLGGDAGVGKTRLTAEVVKQVTEQGVRVLVGRCLDLGDSGSPYLPIREMFDRLGGTDPQVLTELTHAYPGISPLVGSHDSSPGPPGLLVEAIRDALAHLADAAPVLVVVEDAHWADRSTRDLVTYLLGRTLPDRVTLLVTYRSDDLHRRHPLRRNLAEWSRTSAVTRVPLAPLNEQAMRSLIATLVADFADVDSVVARAGGNPFFAEELVAAHGLGRALPEDLADLLLLRVDALGEAPRTVVRTLSAAVQCAGHELLGEVTDLSVKELEHGLRAAVDARVLTVSDGGYAFHHALLGEAVYDDLLPGERVRLHRRFVDALQQHEFPSGAAALAHHAKAAGLREVAITAAARAGDEAMAAAGPADAAAHYQSALALIAEDQDPQRASTAETFELTLAAATALTAASDPYRANELLEAVPADSLTPQQYGWLTLRMAEAWLLTDQPERFTLKLDAAIARAQPGSELHTALLAKLAISRMIDDDFDGAREAADEATRIARDLDLPSITADALTTLARLDDFAGDNEASLRRLDQVISDAVAAGDIDAELRGRHQRHRVLALADDHIGARDEAASTVRRAVEFGAATAPFAIDARVLAAYFAFLTGEWPLADEMLDVAGLGLPRTPFVAMLSAVGAQGAAARGQDAHVLALLPELEPLFGRELMVAIHGGGAALDVLGRAGRTEEMLALHDSIVSTIQATWGLRDFDARIRLSALVIGHLAEARIRGADPSPGVAELAEVAEGVASLRRDETRLGLESRAWLARVRAGRARHDWGGCGEAPQALIAALRADVELMADAKFPYDEAWSRLHLAEALATRGERASAREEVEAVRRTARRLDATPLLDRAGRWSASSTIGEPSSAHLTPREREVLGLVAAGRTNGQIAKELFISTKTASVHVSNILAKVGASTRTEAAMRAAQAGYLN